MCKITLGVPPQGASKWANGIDLVQNYMRGPTSECLNVGKRLRPCAPLHVRPDLKVGQKHTRCGKLRARPHLKGFQSRLTVQTWCPNNFKAAHRHTFHRGDWLWLCRRARGAGGDGETRVMLTLVLREGKRPDPDAMMCPALRLVRIGACRPAGARASLRARAWTRRGPQPHKSC